MKKINFWYSLKNFFAEKNNNLENHEYQSTIIELLQSCIIENGNPQEIYEFAKNVKLADISLLEDVIIESNDIQYIYKFAMNVHDANIYRLYLQLRKLNAPQQYILNVIKKIYLKNILLYKIHNYNRKRALNYLIKSKKKNNNDDIIMDIYMDYLTNPNIPQEYLNELDLLYINHMNCMIKKKM